MKTPVPLWIRMSFLVVFLLGLIAVLVWLHGSLAKNAADLSNARLAVADAEVQERDVQLQKAELERVAETVQSTDAYFIRRDDVLAFITALEDIAGRTQVRQDITSLPVPTAGTQQSTMEVRLEGRLPAIVRYLRAVEQLTYYVNVQRITMTGGAASGNTDGGAERIPTATMSAVVYWL